jgi:hypothetical protein
MTKLDEALEKLRALPEDRQEAVVQHLLWIIEDEEMGPIDGLLTDEQWAELERRLADPNPQYVDHDEVFKRLPSRKA